MKQSEVDLRTVLLRQVVGMVLMIGVRGGI